MEIITKAFTQDDSAIGRLLCQRLTKLQNIYLQAWNSSEQLTIHSFSLQEEDHFHFTDIHGTLRALLNILLSIGVVRFTTSARQIPFYYHDTITEQNYASPEDFLQQQHLSTAESWSQAVSILKHLVILPKLALNATFRGKMTLGGDLTDRGTYSEECFYLIQELLRQQASPTENPWQGQQKIFYLYGNHEDLLIDHHRQHHSYCDHQYYKNLLAIENIDFRKGVRADQQPGIPVYESIGYHRHSPLTETLHEIFLQRYQTLRYHMQQLIRTGILQLSYLQSNKVHYAHSFWSIRDMQASEQFFLTLPTTVPVAVNILPLIRNFITASPDSTSQVSFTDMEQLTNSFNFFFQHSTEYPEFFHILCYPNDLPVKTPGTLGLIWNRPKKYPQLDSWQTRLHVPQIIGHTVVDGPVGVIHDNQGQPGKGSLWYSDTGAERTNNNNQAKYIYYNSTTQQYYTNLLHFSNDDKFLYSETYTVTDFVYK